ncbi:chemotaxis protein CheD [bacterium F16]|nr:chemotaxis protein CheD [bacterium F16]
MAQLILGIGDFGASKTSGDIIKTYGLGSCVAIVLLDPKTRTVGMDHVALPDSTIDAVKAERLPGYFADTGIPALIKQMADMGCDPLGRGFIVKLIGGASMLNAGDAFSIGKRNVLAIKKILWKHRMGPKAEVVGGTCSRTVEVEVATGKVAVLSPQRTKQYV